MKKNLFGLINHKAAIILFILVSSLNSGLAQNTSYNLNSNPIGGGSSTALGFNALINQVSGSIGYDNVAIGHSAMYTNVVGHGNTAVGNSSLYNTGFASNYNTAIGFNALFSVGAFGQSNSGLGAFSDVASSTLYNATAIGSRAMVQNSNSIQLGDSAVTTVYVGVGNTATLITGGLQVTGGSPSIGMVLTSTGSTGVATWQNPNTGDDWHTTGNAGTLDGTNFIGTTDAVPFNVRVNNIASGRIDASLANSFWGYQAGISNSSGNYNTANGYQALYSNTKGYNNTAIGSGALSSNTDKEANTAIGYNALHFDNIGWSNTAVGDRALYANRGGAVNTAVGEISLYNNITGDANAALGESALWSNTTGSANTGVGGGALILNVSGSWNTGCGSGAGGNNVTGTYNSAFGVGANFSATNLNNATAIGSGAFVNTNNKVRIGDNAVTVVEIAATAIYTGSDGRFKKNINETDIKGLEFINRLRPVVYNFDTKKFTEFLTQTMPDSVRKFYLDKDFSRSTAIRQSGFIAQEVEVAAKESGYDFNGLHKPESEYDNYSLAYSQFVVPLVKSVQELSKQNEEMRKEIDELKALIKSNIDENKTGSIKISSQPSVQLFQNVPNPFNKSTIIRYSIPLDTKNAMITITNTKGTKMAEYDLINKGGESIEISGGKLTAGTYIYSLIVNGELIDSKKMILTY